MKNSKQTKEMVETIETTTNDVVIVEQADVTSFEQQIEEAKALLALAKAQKKEAQKNKKSERQLMLEKRANAEIFKFEQSAKLPTVMSVSVGRSLAKGKSVLEAASGHWKMSEIKAMTIKTVVAEHNAIIVDVFRVISNTLVPESEDGTNRYWFELEKDEELSAQWVGLRIQKQKGMASPVIYRF